MPKLDRDIGQLGVVPCVTLPCVACFELLHSEQHCLVRGQHGSTRFKFEGLIVVNILKFYLSELDFNSLNNISFVFKVFYELVV